MYVWYVIFINFLLNIKILWYILYLKFVLFVVYKLDKKGDNWDNVYSLFYIWFL